MDTFIFKYKYLIVSSLVIIMNHLIIKIILSEWLLIREVSHIHNKKGMYPLNQIHTFFISTTNMAFQWWGI